VSKKKMDVAAILGMLVVGIGGIALLNEIATNPRISPFWRKIAETAEGDLYQHIISGAVVTIFA
jgi:hypothetical protein